MAMAAVPGLPDVSDLNYDTDEDEYGKYSLSNFQPDEVFANLKGYLVSQMLKSSLATRVLELFPWNG